MKTDLLQKLSIPEEKKRGGARGPLVLVAIVVAVLAVALASFVGTGKPTEEAPAETAAAPAPVTGVGTGDVLLTVSGYVIPRERIAISPRFIGTVTWIGVKKGDRVRKGDVLVRLDDAEQRARVKEAEGGLALAKANLANAEAEQKRAADLFAGSHISRQEYDAAERALAAAQAARITAEGQLDVAKTYLDWCTITAPIDGAILEKLVNPNELVTPQSFGGSGPSTAFLAMADLSDLQVEIDLNEVDTPKVRMGQLCRVSPEAYPDKVYEGIVAEIAPEASRAKGTLQVKVQIRNPDEFLTPELTAKVEFLK